MDVQERLVAAARGSGVTDARVLRAVHDVPRERFVTRESRLLVAGDRPLQIPCGQTTSQPSLIALILQALELSPHDRVLEIGTGLGYEAALLGELVAQVWTVEFFSDLAERARRNLIGQPHVQVVCADGTAGWPEQGPYDAVVLAAATPHLDDALVGQLVEGGRLIAPIGPGGDEMLVRWVRRDGCLTERTALMAVRYVPLLSARSAEP